MTRKKKKSGWLLEKTGFKTFEWIDTTLFYKTL